MGLLSSLLELRNNGNEYTPRISILLQVPPPNATPQVINLKLVDFVFDDAQSQNVFNLSVMDHPILCFECESFGEMMIWAGSLSRAILAPRRKNPAMPLSSLYRGVIPYSAPQNLPLAIMAKVAMGAAVYSGVLKFPSKPGMMPSVWFCVLRRHLLCMWRSEELFAKGKMPSTSLFLNHDVVLIKQSPTSFQIQLDAKSKVLMFEVMTEKETDEWIESLTCSLECLRVCLREYLLYYNEVAAVKVVECFLPLPEGPPPPFLAPIMAGEDEVEKALPSPVLAPVEEEDAAEELKPQKEPPPEFMEELQPPNEPPPELTGDFQPPNGPPPEFIEAAPELAVPQIEVEEKQSDATITIQPIPPIEEENVPTPPQELDLRPTIRLKKVLVDASGVRVPESEADTTSFHADIRANFEDTMINIRCAIHEQLNPDLVPVRFAFLKPATAFVSSLGGSEDYPLNLQQEDQFLLKDMLVTTSSSSFVLTISCPAKFILPTVDFATERNAYLQEIAHLEAQLAEARRLLSMQNAKKFLTEEETAENANRPSQLRVALLGLQRDVFLDKDVDINALERVYLETFDERDALKAFAASPSSPLRGVWRRLCADPAKFRQYIEDLERFVLIPYRIGTERLSSPFWTTHVLCEDKFVRDSGLFQLWAKEEPWCENDQERFVYLTRRLLNTWGSVDNFKLLLRPVPGKGGAMVAAATIATQQALPLKPMEKTKSLLAMMASDAAHEMKKRQSSRRMAVTQLQVGGGPVDPFAMAPPPQPDVV